MQIAIVGAGTLDGLFGAKLADAGEDVVLIDTWSEHVSAVNDEGLLVHTPDGGWFVRHPEATTEAARIDPVDRLFITVKTDATVAALKAGTPVINQETMVTSFQNGFTAYDTIPDRLKNGMFADGTTRHGAQVKRPGAIVDDATGETVVGNGDDAAERLAKVFTAVGFETEATTGVGPYLYDKQFVSNGIKPAAALTRYTNGDLVAFDASMAVLEKLVSEADRVREACGIEAITSDPVAMVKAFCRENPDHVLLALEDVHQCRKTEIEHITGAVARYGEQVGISVPYNQLVADLVPAKEQQYMSRSTRSNG